HELTTLSGAIMPVDDPRVDDAAGGGVDSGKLSACIRTDPRPQGRHRTAQRTRVAAQPRGSDGSLPAPKPGRAGVEPWCRLREGPANHGSVLPNPVLSIGTVWSFAKKQFGESSNVLRSGQLHLQIQQLFEMAGKRGYRIESTSYGTQSAEANFENA